MPQSHLYPQFDIISRGRTLHLVTRIVFTNCVKCMSLMNRTVCLCMLAGSWSTCRKPSPWGGILPTSDMFNSVTPLSSSSFFSLVWSYQQSVLTFRAPAKANRTAATTASSPVFIMCQLVLDVSAVWERHTKERKGTTATSLGQAGPVSCLIRENPSACSLLASSTICRTGNFPNTLGNYVF